MPATLLLATVLLAATAAEPGPTVDVPKSQGWVTDLAGIFGPGQKQALAALMESYKKGTSHEIAVLIVPELDGGSIESYALDVARSWGIGGKQKNNGALLVVAVKERKLRIEVGRGLEGALPDSICGRIIRDVITPEFKAGRYYDGVSQGVSAIHAAVGGDYGPIERRRRSGRRGGGGAMIALLPLVFMAVVFGSRRRRRYLGAHGGMGSEVAASPAGSCRLQGTRRSVGCCESPARSGNPTLDRRGWRTKEKKDRRQIN